MSLRERQKADRRMRIIGAAKGLFAQSGIDTITIESIAEIAGVSSMTVHNYYGTKSGVLLAMIAENDAELLEILSSDLAGRSDDLVNLVSDFAEIICDHSLSNLDKEIWRQVIAASVANSDPQFSAQYRTFDEKLLEFLVAEVEFMKSKNLINRNISSYDLGSALFGMYTMRFIYFISIPSQTKSNFIGLLRRDTIALLNAKTGTAEPN